MFKSLALMSALLLSLPHAAAQTAATCPAKAIRVAFYEMGLFYSKGNGLDKDVVDELRKRSGCSFETVVMPRGQIWEELAAGTVDMTPSGIRTPARDKFATFAFYIQQKNYALLSKELPGKLASLDEFSAAPAGLKWGIVQGFKHGSYYDPQIAKLMLAGRVAQLADSDQLFTALKEKKVVGALALPMVYRSLLKQHGIEGAVTVVDLKPGLEQIPHGMVFGKHMFADASAKQWQALVDGMNQDGTMKRLIGNYLTPDETAASLIK